MAKEVEIKFLVHDLKALERRLRQSGFRLKTRRTHEMNTLYDTADGQLRNRGELLRLRRYGERCILTHKAKGKPGRHKSRVESETEIADAGALDAILRPLGFTPSFRYEKFRAEWSDGEGEVVVDETPIGNLAEIEGPPRWIDRTARQLGVPRAAYITDNYAQLFFAWKARTGSSASEMTFKAARIKAPTKGKRTNDSTSERRGQGRSSRSHRVI